MRKERLDDPAQEFERLKKGGFISPDEESKLEEILPQAAPKALLAQALGIKRALQKTHRVFLHAQSTRWMVFTYLLKEMMRKRHPETNLRHFKFLRNPADLSESKTIEKYSQNPRTYDHDEPARTELVSVDAYFYNTQGGGESAHYFLTRNANVVNNEGLIQDIAKRAIQSFYPLLSSAEANSFAENLSGVAVELAPCANLFAICIPEEQLPEVVYRAHPLGSPCFCHEEEKSVEILDHLQEGRLPQEAKCAIDYFFIPQYRLFTPLLKPETGQRIYHLSPLPKETRKKMKGAIARLVDSMELRHRKWERSKKSFCSRVFRT